MDPGARQRRPLKTLTDAGTCPFAAVEIKSTSPEILRLREKVL